MTNRKVSIPKEVEAFKNIKDINKIKQYLKGKSNLRDYTIFVIGINIGLRAGDLLKLKWNQVIVNTELGNSKCENENTELPNIKSHNSNQQIPISNIKKSIYIIEEKTSKNKEIELNESVRIALQEFYDSVDTICLDDYIFTSRKGTEHLQVRSLHRIINDVVKELGIKGNYGTHSMRKTWGYHRYNAGVRLETLQHMFNHSTQAMTLKYIGITKEVIIDAYNLINL